MVPPIVTGPISWTGPLDRGPKFFSFHLRLLSFWAMDQGFRGMRFDPIPFIYASIMSGPPICEALGGPQQLV